MFDNAVVGVDGREGGREAIALAKRLVSADARVALANVYGDGLLLRAGGVPLATEHEDSQRRLAGAAQSGWRLAETVSKRADSVGKGLHELAFERSADLLVVGSCHHGLIGRVLMGDDTRAAFNGAPCALAIAPRGYAPREDDELPGAVCVAYDGSPSSDRALDVARGLAAQTGATVKALWVVGVEEVHERAPLPADWTRTSKTLVQEVQSRLDALEGVEGEAIYGGPREELLSFARPEDLLIVGSRGYGPYASVFHGSVSSYLQRHAHCPLVIVPREAAPAARTQVVDGPGRVAIAAV